MENIPSHLKARKEESTPKQSQSIPAHPNPNVAKAFMNGFGAVERALSTLGPEQLQEIFGDHGQNYINAEIMYTKNPNIIVYSGDWIVLHNMHQFDDEGKKTIETGGLFSTLVDAVSSAEGEMDKEGWGMSGPKPVELQDISDGSAYEEFAAALDTATGMSDSATVGDFVAEQLRTGPVGSLSIAVNLQEEVIKTILGTEGAKSIKDLKKLIPKDMHKEVSAMATVAKRKSTIARMVGPIEKAISDFAIEVMRGMLSFFVDGHDEEMTRMKGELERCLPIFSKKHKINSNYSDDYRSSQSNSAGDPALFGGLAFSSS